MYAEYCRRALWLLMILLLAITGRSFADDRKPDSEEKISQRMQAITSGYPWQSPETQIYGDWGGAVAVLREAGRSSSSGLPDRWTVYTFDFKARKLNAFSIPGITHATHLASDGKARVVAGVDSAGVWRVMRQNGEKWEEIGLPEEIQKSRLRRVIRSEGQLAIAIPEAVFRWRDGKWNKTLLPPPIQRLWGLDRTNDVVVVADALLIGSTYYLGWVDQHPDSMAGGFISIDLDAEPPKWRFVYGEADPAKGIQENRGVSVLSSGPKGQILLCAESDLDQARVYQFDGKEWHKRVDVGGSVPGDSPALAMLRKTGAFERMGALQVDGQGVLHLLSPQGVFVLRENKLSRILPGPIPSPTSLYVDDGSGNLLVGAGRAGVLLFEKVDGGYQLHEPQFP